MVHKFFDTKASSPDRKTVRSGVNENIKLANELHKPIIKKFNKRKVYSSFKDNIWGADLADMQLLSKFNKGIKYLLCVIDLFSKYAFVVPLKDKKGISIVNAFQSILSKSKRKPNKIWVDKGSEFYNASFKNWLQDHDIVMYSTNNEGKSVVAERFIRTLKSKIYKYMTSISKNVYIDKLNTIVNKYNNIYHITIKMKPIDVKDNTYINTNKEINYKDPKFKVGDYVRISKYKNIFAKGYMPNWNEEVFVVNKIKNTVPWTYVINDLNGEEVIGTFFENELQKTIKMSQYFPPYTSSSENIKAELDLSNYATKKDISDITHVDVSGFASKTKVDKIDTDKLKTVPADLAKLTNAVENDLVKKN